MRTPSEDAEVSDNLRTFDLVTAALLKHGISAGHLKARVELAAEDMAALEDSQS